MDFCITFCHYYSRLLKRGGTDGNTTTTDSTPPTNTTQPDFINSGATSTNSTSGTLAISATDNVGVTGYCATESATTPSATDACWQSITSTTSYSSTSVSFALSSGDGTKTVYVWFKDAAGNVSASASDSITLSTTVSGTLFPIATTTGAEFSMSAAFDETNYLVGIEEGTTTSSLQKAQIISQSGTLVGPRISAGTTGGAPFVAFDGTNYLMVWVDDSNATGNFNIYGQLISKSGSTVGSPFAINQASGKQDLLGPQNIVFGGGNYLVIWDDCRNAAPNPQDPNEPINCNSDVYGQLISTSGTLIGSEIPIATDHVDPVGQVGGQDDFNASVAFDGANFLVVFAAERRDTTFGGEDIYGQFVSTTGSLVGSNFLINQNDFASDNPTIAAFDGTNYLVVWMDEVGGFGSGEWDIFGQRVDTSGNPVGGVINISTAQGEQFYPFIAFDGTNYLVTWTDMRNDINKNGICDAGEGTCDDIYGQYISTSGLPVGSEFAINTDAGNQLGGAPVFAGGKYLALINTGITLDPTGDWLSSKVYGLFITP